MLELCWILPSFLKLFSRFITSFSWSRCLNLQDYPLVNRRHFSTHISIICDRLAIVFNIPDIHLNIKFVVPSTLDFIDIVRNSSSSILNLHDITPPVFRFLRQFPLFVNLLFKPYSRWTFLGLFTDRGGGRSKKASSLKSVAHILKWWNLTQLYLT